MENTQDFIEKYYPNYHSCGQIAKWNDLSVIMYDKSLEDHIIAWNVFKNEFNSSKIQAAAAYDEINAEIMEKAIQGYLSLSNENRYLAFGTDLCNLIDHEGAHMAALNMVLFSGSINKVTPKTTLAQILEMHAGWKDYSFISKQEYEFIESFDPDDEVQVAQVYLIEFIRLLILAI